MPEPIPVSMTDLMRIGVIGLFAVTSAIWGSTWLAIKYQLTGVAPEVSVAYRFALAAALLAAWCLATGRSLRFSRRDHALSGCGRRNALRAQLRRRLLGRAFCDFGPGRGAVLDDRVPQPDRHARVLRHAADRADLRRGRDGRRAVSRCCSCRSSRKRATAARVSYGVAFGLGATVIASGGNLIAQRNQRAGIPTLAGNAWGMAYGALVAAVTASVQGVEWTFDARPAYLVSLAYLTRVRQRRRVRRVSHLAAAHRRGARGLYGGGDAGDRTGAIDAVRGLPLDLGRRARRGAGDRRQRAGAASDAARARKPADAVASASGAQFAPRLKNSRCPRIAPIRLRSSCKWPGSSTKFRRSLLTISSGAPAYW